MKKIRQYVKIIFVSLIFFVYLGEYYLTFVVFEKGEMNKANLNKKIEIYKKETGKDFDTRKKVEIYNQEFAYNNNISVTVDPFFKTNQDFFYLSGISNSKTINCNENGFYSTYNSDRYGFNNNDGVWDLKDYEYALVGDSFVLGNCVDYSDNISYNLKTLTNQSVINLGYAGNGPLTQYATLVEYLPKKTKNILWFYYEDNDLHDLRSELQHKKLNKYLSYQNTFANLKAQQELIDHFHRTKIEERLISIENSEKYWNEYYSNKKFLLRFLRLNNFKRLVGDFVSKKIRKEKKENEIIFKKFKEILNLTKELAFENESNIYFVYLGSYYRYNNSIFSKINYEEEYNKVINIVNELGIPIIDTHKDFFIKQKNPLNFFPFESYGHYNAKGYKKISEVIYNKIKN